MIPKVPGADRKNVMHAVDMYGHENEIRNKIVIIGGGVVGCVACVHLQSQGKNVTVVEMGSELMAEVIEIKEEKFFTEYYMTHEFDMSRSDFVNVKEIDHVTVHLN